MAIYLAKRLASAVLIMLVISLILFALFEADKDAIAISVLGPYAMEEQRSLWLEANGYNQPMAVRYFQWLGGAITFDFGESLRYKVPVSDILLERLWNTAVLGFWAFMFMVMIGLVLGVLAGMREGSRLDRTISVVSIGTTSVPEFASAVLMSFIFVFYLQWLPGTSGMADGFDPLQLILPVLVLVTYSFGYVARMTRASMADVMQQHYIRTAFLKGLPYQTVILRHALRNALIAPFTIIVLQINWLLSGVIVVEYFFNYKGYGSLLIEAALNRDVYLVQGCAVVAVLVAVSTQVLADIGYMYLNPRIRFS
jgi:peptide/nickel transport system permease protein